MVKSMTGYGRAEETVKNCKITVELRAVNHKYLEYSARVPRRYGFLEEKLKRLVQSRVARGKVDVYLGMEKLEDTAAEVHVNHTLAEGYVKALTEVAQKNGLPLPVTVGDVVQCPELFTVTRAPENEDDVWADVRPVAEKALDAFVAMRETEGAQLVADVLSRAQEIERCVGLVEERSPETVRLYREKLEARLREVLEEKTIDEQRILTEAAIFADRVAVAEETVRLRSHIAQLRAFLSSGEPSGRKLDFLVQEMNREANTIGSECSDTEIAYTVIEIKAEIEKIREQIQNIE